MMSGPNACATPETFKPDPGYRTVKVPEIKAYGIDLDGQIPAPRASRHQARAPTTIWSG